MMISWLNQILKKGKPSAGDGGTRWLAAKKKES